ncbi:MAG: GNAT family N-acetyltransferase [Gemmatimonadota bacterium]
MWLPEREVKGPLPLAEKDIPALNRLFAEAFTDRYRRDGLVGVRVPYLNTAIWRYALADAGAGAMGWRDESDRLVAFNITHCSGAEGWMGPLAVRPDRQTGGLGKTIVSAAIDWLRAQGVTTLGLETMPRTVDNIGFYSRLGFVPSHLTITMTAEAAGGAGAGYTALGTLEPAERERRLAEVRALVAELAPGVDFAREIQLTHELRLGDVLVVGPPGAVTGFALCHSAPLAENGARDETRVLKVAARSLDALLAVLDAAEAWAAREGARRIGVRCQTGYGEAFRALVRRGFRVRWTDLRMTLAGHPETPPAAGVVWSNWEV